jgi:hypothetical protein
MAQSMLDESMSSIHRDPTAAEVRLLEFLFHTARQVGFHQLSLKGLQVANLKDGGMGSLRLFPISTDWSSQQFGRAVSACTFDDEDGVAVIATLYLDRSGGPFELDVWRTDFGELIRIPEDPARLIRATP